MSDWPFATLGCEPGADPIAIKRAYAKKLKSVRPDDDPEGYQALRQAYEVALAWAYQRDDDDDDAPAREPLQSAAIPIPAGHHEAEPRQLAVDALAGGGSALRADALAAPSTHDDALAAEQRAQADDQRQRVARIRATLAEVDRIGVDDLHAWWKRLEPDFAQVPLAHCDLLSRQMAGFVAERPGFPDWLVERFAATFGWEQDFRRSREIPEIAGLRERLAALRARTGQQADRWWRLHRIDEALANGKAALALSLAVLFAPRVHEHFSEIGTQRWSARFRSPHQRANKLMFHSWLFNYAVPLFVLFLAIGVLGPDVHLKAPGALDALLGVYLLAAPSWLLDRLAGRVPEWLVNAWKARFASGGAAILGAVILGLLFPEQLWAVVTLVIAAFALTHSGTRWRPVWLPLCFAPSLIYLNLGLVVPAWVICLPAAVAFTGHWAMTWRLQETLGYFRWRFSELYLGGGTVAVLLILVLVIGFRVALPLLATVSVLSLPLIVAVQARTYGVQHGLRVIALASAMTVLTTGQEVIPTVWIVWLAACLLLGLLAVLSSAAIAEKLIKRQLASS